MNPSILKIIAYICSLAGLFGMMFCFPYLWSGRLIDVVGAGLPFVAGAILLAGGLITLAITGGKANEDKKVL